MSAQDIQLDVKQDNKGDSIMRSSFEHMEQVTDNKLD